MTRSRLPAVLLALLAALLLSVGLAAPASAATPATSSRPLPQTLILTVASTGSGRTVGTVAVRPGQIVLVVRGPAGGLDLVTANGRGRDLRIVDTTSTGVVATLTRGRTVLSRTTIGPRRTEIITLPAAYR